MEGPLDEQYFTWLYDQVANPRLKNPSRTHWKLLLQLHRKEFSWFVPNDDNRCADGIDLRREFMRTYQVGHDDPGWADLGCSMLEMLMGLASRLSFEADGEARVWFWHLIENVDLYQFNDRVYDNRAVEQIDHILDNIIWRRYAPDGRGGLFPLRNPPSDQRHVELWYQLCAYVVELL